MKKLLILIASVGMIATGCRKIEVDGGTTVVNNGSGATENTILEGRIITNLTLKAQYTYKLRGLVYVTSGAILTIEPGTKIVGENGKNGALIITRGAKIIADGTADKPIVFTSEAANPQRGDWAGLVILGQAPNNSSYNGVDGVGEIEGGVNNSDGLGLYGLGTTSNLADNSGILRYVRIEYAGYAFLPDKEINGLTLGGVGNQTIVDYVQVSYANDDSFEWFGGSVNCKHLISYRTLDDDFDTDNGYSGKVQFGIILRDSSIADISKSEAFESDNDANGSDRTTFLVPIPVSANNPVAINPVKTSAVFSNITVLGPKATAANNGNSLFLAAAQIRRNSEISIFNSVFMGWNGGSVSTLLIDASKGTPTDKNLDPTGGLNFKNNIIAGGSATTAITYAASATAPTGATATTIQNWVNTAAYGNSFVANNTDVGLGAPFNYTAPDFNPAAGSAAASGASFTSAKLMTKTGTVNDFTTVAYKGACAVGDAWWKTWTAFK
ncbi:hypothetical protein GWC95_16335 [Sediminibacterium roseum]|uniref:T9SS C-terminal target domain-containing protein n=1 Tax=Sediminibacterium roseum TaxID=1978412 RepID=A0ABW9ZZ21_9BACT|nr:hypothetical protein [Sediminibacterium roseum]NCI51499.1 hypothetical protein [Sediminibacterium roseum]